MIVVQVDVVDVSSEASGSHHHVGKGALSQGIEKRIIAKILRDNDDTIEGPVADNIIEVVHQVRIFVRFDIEAQAVVGLVNNSQDALLQIVKEGCLMNDVRYLNRSHHQQSDGVRL